MDKIHQVLRLSTTYVINAIFRFVGIGGCQHLLDSGSHIINIGEVPLHLAVVIDLYLLPQLYPACKLEVSHVGAAVRAIYSEEPESYSC